MNKFVTLLDEEALRFQTLATQEAARHFLTPNPATAERAKQHYLRAETFRAAARLVEKAGAR